MTVCVAIICIKNYSDTTGRRLTTPTAARKKSTARAIRVSSIWATRATWTRLKSINYNFFFKSRPDSQVLQCLAAVPEWRELYTPDMLSQWLTAFSFERISPFQQHNVLLGKLFLSMASGEFAKVGFVKLRNLDKRTFICDFPAARRQESRRLAQWHQPARVQEADGPESRRVLDESPAGRRGVPALSPRSMRDSTAALHGAIDSRLLSIPGERVILNKS